MNRIASAIITATAALTLAVVGAQGQASAVEPVGRVSAHPNLTASTSCRPSVWPTTAAGYANLWANIDPAKWGAADGNLSVKLGDGRVAWFYGDTFSTYNGGRFVHSTAIVQTGTCLHVANGGAQVVPNVDDRHIFWIDTVKPNGLHGVVIKARAVTITEPGNVWGFADGGYSVKFTAWFNRFGDLKITGQGERVYEPAADQGPMLVFGEHHFGYGIRFHRWAKLGSGKVLTSVNQNWDDGVLHPFADYRPIWLETDGRQATVVEMYR